MPAIKSVIKSFWSEDKKIKYENAMALLIRYLEKTDKKILNESGKHIIRYKEKRLKTPDSIEDKLKRKEKYQSGIKIEEMINDLAGVRVVCFDKEQVYQLVEEVKKTKEFDLIKEKDYIQNPKENGYQSYHMILEIIGVKVELQIRTILMDAWSSLDTVLIYKKKDVPPKELVEKIEKFSRWSKKMDQMIEEMLEEKGQKK